MSYIAPIADMRFVMVELAGLGAVGELPGLADATPDLVDAVLEEAAKFASNVLAPPNRAGDVDGAKLVDGQVLTTPGWKEAYQAFVEAGWNGLVFDPEWGGQGLPWLVNAAVQEMWHASNMSFGLCPLLTQGAIEAILFHGSDDQRQLYLPKLVSGEWTGTMCLTEPQAGSDLSAVKTRAVRSGDNYIITGQKIFITYGDHDLTPNIVHLVLARTPDAPEGVKGISLFSCLVPARRERRTGQRQRRALCLSRTQARHPRQPHRRARLRGWAGGNRLADRGGKSRPRVHVHDDERCPALRRDRRPCHRGSRLPTGAHVRARSRPGQGAGREPRSARQFSIPRRPANADEHEGTDRGYARRRLCLRRCRRPGASPF